jgi:pyrroline-5-carboxylate reductase
MSAPVIGFIGAGNMARALIGGLIDAGHPATRIRAGDPDPAGRAAIDALGAASTANNDEAIADATIVILAVKPQVARTVVGALQLRPDQLLVSICAGVPIARLAEWTNALQPIVRCMPNTPALLRAGITALHANDHVDHDMRAAAEQVLTSVGATVWVEREEELDAVTAVSGSGPAYFFYLMEAMIEGGTALGLEPGLARRLTIETALGAARMAHATDRTPAQLRVAVTSPGGTTEAALRVFEEAGTRARIANALKAAAVRAGTLAREV